MKIVRNYKPTERKQSVEREKKYSEILRDKHVLLCSARYDYTSTQRTLATCVWVLVCELKTSI